MLLKALFLETAPVRDCDFKVTFDSFGVRGGAGAGWGANNVLMLLPMPHLCFARALATPNWQKNVPKRNIVLLSSLKGRTPTPSLRNEATSCMGHSACRV